VRSRPAAAPTSGCASSPSRRARGSASRCWSRTGPAPTAISQPNISRAPSPTATRSSSIRRHRSPPTCSCSRTRRPTSTKQILTVATLLRFSFYLTVDAKRPWKNVEELTAYLRRKGDKASFATTSPPGRLMGNLFKEIMQLKAVEVPYRTSPDTLNDLASGQLDYSFTDGVFAHAQEREQRLRILAVGSKERMNSDPNIPTMQETGGCGTGRSGVFRRHGAAGTPRPVIDKINGWMVDTVAQPMTQEFINNFGGDPLTTTPRPGAADVPRRDQGMGPAGEACQDQTRGLNSSTSSAPNAPSLQIGSETGMRLNLLYAATAAASAALVTPSLAGDTPKDLAYQVIERNATPWRRSETRSTTSPSSACRNSRAPSC